MSDKAKELLLQKTFIGQLRPLIGLKDADHYLKIILKNKLNSRDIEKLIKKRNTRLSNKKNKNVDILDLEKELAEITGLEVSIRFDSLKQKGNIMLKCKNVSEFNYIVNKIRT